LVGYHCVFEEKKESEIDRKRERESIRGVVAASRDWGNCKISCLCVCVCVCLTEGNTEKKKEMERKRESICVCV